MDAAAPVVSFGCSLVTTAGLGEQLAAVTPAERAALSPFAVPKRQAEFCAGRRAAREALGRAVGHRRAVESHVIATDAGPRVLGPALGAHVSISHAGAVAVAAAAVFPVGLDVAVIEPVSGAAVGDAVTPSEIRAWRSIAERVLHVPPPLLAFAAKEANLKVRGAEDAGWRSQVMPLEARRVRDATAPTALALVQISNAGRRLVMATAHAQYLLVLALPSGRGPNRAR